LSDAFDAEYLLGATRKRSVAIKQFIMNSQVVVGVGNIYASEALFRARISPRRAARRITRKEAAVLAQAIKDVLGEAIKIGGTTLRDYVNADGAPGYFSQKLFVYERKVRRAGCARRPSSNSSRASVPRIGARPASAEAARRRRLVHESDAFAARIGGGVHPAAGEIPGDYLHVAPLPAGHFQ